MRCTKQTPARQEAVRLQKVWCSKRGLSATISLVEAQYASTVGASPNARSVAEAQYMSMAGHGTPARRVVGLGCASEHGRMRS